MRCRSESYINITLFVCVCVCVCVIWKLYGSLYCIVTIGKFNMGRLWEP